MAEELISVVSVVGENIRAKLGEGPHWDTETRKLFWVDCLDCSVHVLDVETGKDKSYQLDDIVGCVIPRKKGGSVILACKRRLLFLDLETGEKEVVVAVDEDKPENHLNDGKCDPLGRLWVGSMGPESEPAKPVLEQGSLFSLSGDKKLTKWVDKISISNGMTWSLDKKTFYYIDSFLRTIYAFDYDEEAGTISHRRIAVKNDPSLGFPDGMTIDAEGMLWVAMYDGWKVVRFDPVTGDVIREVDIPVAKVTSCCWGGPNLDELFVTSERWREATEDTEKKKQQIGLQNSLRECLSLTATLEAILRMSPEEKKAQPLAGSIFRVKNLGTHGFPAVPFDG